MKNLSKRKLITIILSSLLTVAITVVTLVLIFQGSSDNGSEFNPTTDSYLSDKPHITSDTPAATSTTVSMAEAISNPGGTEIIRISSADDLYNFSVQCEGNNKANFLKRHYILTSNIDFANRSNKNSTFFRPIGWNTPFTGTFDGQGFEITNLQLVDITQGLVQASGNNPYDGMKYFATFSQIGSGGKLQNLGIVESENLTLTVEMSSIIDDLGGVAQVVGCNSGTVSNVYYRDLRKVDDFHNGINAAGGYRIAGFAYENKGTLSNCYFAVSTTANYEVDDYEIICPGIYENSGTISNYSYLDKTVSSYNGTGTGSNISNTVEYGDTFIPLSFEGHNYGTYCSTLNSLNANYTDGWYTAEDYPSAISEYFYKKNASGDYLNKTPSLRGFDIALNSTTNKYEADINDVNDFLFMYEMMNVNPFFASNSVTYLVKGDINLLNIDPYAYYYDTLIESTITGISGTYGVKPTLSNGQTSTYPTIYNFDAIDQKRMVVTTGIDSYGLFPYLTGTVSNLNVMPKAVALANVKTSTNIKAIGAVSGYVEKGIIDNVNVKLTVTQTSDIKEFYLGGITGILAADGTISNSTASGSYTADNISIAAISTSTKTKGIAMGGIVGYVDDNFGDVKTCLSGVNMTLRYNASAPVQIGGVIGAGYTDEAYELENIGTINIGSSNTAYNQATELYVAGIIGRHLGVSSTVHENNESGQVKYFTNQGEMNIYVGGTATNKTYVAGIENADIITTAIANTGIIPSANKTKSGNIIYRASSMTNRANINIVYASGYSNTIEYTSGINVFNKNGFVSEISGLYNLAYQQKFSGSTTQSKTNLNAFSVNANVVHNYAPLLNAINGDSADAIITLRTAYNLRDINVVNTKTSGYTYDAINGETLTFTGATIGKYIDFIDVRNEGNITFNATTSMGNSTNYTNVILAGVMEEVSGPCTANTIYNGGDISFTFTVLQYTNLYLSGICHKNLNGYTDSELNEFNPLTAAYDSKKTGSLNNAINNGDISVDNTNLSSVSFSHNDNKSSNGGITNGRVWSTSYSGIVIYGNIISSGITYDNESVITNTFNLGDVFAANFIKDTNKNEIISAGIAGLNIGKAAYILNSANNGEIKALNMSSYTSYFASGATTQVKTDAANAYVTSGGIIGRNDVNNDATLTTYNGGNNHTKQLVSFTINYGGIYTYSYYQNDISSASTNFRSASGGIVGSGLLNTINVVNYGVVGSNQLAGGIFGLLFFDRFASEVKASNTMTLANTMDYGNIYVLSKGMDDFNGGTTYLTYANFKDLDETTTSRLYTYLELYQKDYYIGSIFGILNFNLNNSAQYVTIRYLIGLNGTVPLIGAEAATPSVTVDRNRMYSSYKAILDGEYVPDTYLNGYVQYAPIATGTEQISTGTYYGAFNNNFAFMKAVNGVGLDTDHYASDKFISDYFEFVPYKYINSELLDKIGWRDSAYSAAANEFAMQVSNIVTLFSSTQVTTTDNAINYENIYSNISGSAWMRFATKTVLENILDAYVTGNLSTSTVMNYFDKIFTNQSAYITSSNLNSILTTLDEKGYANYSSQLNGILSYQNGYTQLLADIMLESDSGTIKLALDEFITALDDSTKIQLINNYVDHISNNYFTYSNNEQVRQQMLLDFFNNLDETTYPAFYEALYKYLEIDESSISDTLKAINGYSSLTSADKLTLFENIIDSTNATQFDTYLDTMETDNDLYGRLREEGYTADSMSEIQDVAKLTATSTDPTVINERVALWNQIKDTRTFQTYINSKYTTNKYYMATEYRNTYQSFTEPHNTPYDKYNLEYSYTTKVTPQTYFYGPYHDETGSTTYTVSDSYLLEDMYSNSGYGTNGQRAIMDFQTYADWELFFKQGYVTMYRTFLYEWGDQDSNNQFCGVDVEVPKGTDARYAFTWFKSKRATDFTGSYLYGTYDENGVLDETDPQIEVDGKLYNINGGAISKFTSNSDGSTGEGGYTNNLTRTGTWFITDANGNRHKITGTVTDWADYIIEHAKRHYVCGATSLYHSTRRSGIYKYRSGTRWFTWGKEGRTVYTSQYIDYTVNDLLKLDGVLTEYDGKTLSNDERNIINTLFNTYFVTDGNFLNIVHKALFESTFEYLNPVQTGYTFYTEYYYNRRRGNKTYKVDRAQTNIVDNNGVFTLTTWYWIRFNTNGTQRQKVNNQTCVITPNVTNGRVTSVNVTNNFGSSYQTTINSDGKGFKVDITVLNNYSQDDMRYDLHVIYHFDNLFAVPTGYSSITSNAGLIGTTNSVLGDIDGFNDFVSTGVYSDKQINSDNPLNTLLRDTSNTTNSKLYNYLKSLYGDVSSLDYKDKVIQAASSNKDEYADLLKVIINNNISAADASSAVSTQKSFTIGDKTFGYIVGETYNDTKTVSITAGWNTYLLVSSNTGFTVYNNAQCRSEDVVTSTYNNGIITINGTNLTNVSTLYVKSTGASVLYDIIQRNPSGEIKYYNQEYNPYENIQPSMDMSNRSYTNAYAYMFKDPNGGPCKVLLNKNDLATEIGDSTDYKVYLNTRMRTYAADNASKRKTVYITIDDVDIVSAPTFNNATPLVSYTLGSTNIPGRSYVAFGHANTVYAYSDLYQAAYNAVTLWGSNTNLIDVTTYVNDTNNTYYLNAYQRQPNGYQNSVTYPELHFQYIQYTITKATYVSVLTDKPEANYLNYADAALRLSNLYNSGSSTPFKTLLNEVISNLSPMAYNDYATEFTTSSSATISSMLREILSRQADGGEAFTRLLLTNSTNAMYNFLNNVISVSDYKTSLGDILKSLAETNYRFTYEVVSNTSNPTDNMKKVLAAAYVVVNYINIYNQSLTDNTINVGSTLLKTIMSGTYSVNEDYQYINSDGTFNNDKFDALLEILGIKSDESSYGIYALSSSTGIQNGTFIPDNVDLTAMDAQYDTTTANFIELIDSDSSTWRGTVDSVVKADYPAAQQDTVNYHIKIEMKQLVKSIAITIFDLDLNVNNKTISTSNSQIEENGSKSTIIYYVSDAQIDYIKGQNILPITKFTIADTATKTNPTGNTLSILNKELKYERVTGLAEETFNANKSRYYIYNAGSDSYVAQTNGTYSSEATYYRISSIVVKDAVTITAEETSVVGVYTIHFIRIDTDNTFTFTKMTYVGENGEVNITTLSGTNGSNTPIPYSGATIKFTVTGAGLVENMDVRQFLSIVDNSTGAKEELGSAWMFDPTDANNGLVTDHTAVMTLIVDISMSQGVKNFVFDIFGSSTTIKMTKSPNTLNKIVKFGYEGSDYAATMNSSKALSQEIQFGRAFNYTDLTAPYVLTSDTAIDPLKTYYTRFGENDYYNYKKVTSPTVDNISSYYEKNEDFYLYDFEVSDNATVKITVTKSDDALMVYTIVFAVKSELGSGNGAIVEYTHTLTEMDYFTDGTPYGTLYKEGETFTDYYTGEFEYDGVTYDGTKSEVTYNTGDDNYVAVIFNRGEYPEYRIKYVLANFYDFSNTSNFTYVQEGKNPGLVFEATTLTASTYKPYTYYIKTVDAEEDINDEYAIATDAFDSTQTYYIAATSSKATLNETYAGPTVTVTDAQNPGVYAFNFVYSRTGEWDSTSEIVLASSGNYNSNASYYVKVSDWGIDYSSEYIPYDVAYPIIGDDDELPPLDEDIYEELVAENLIYVEISPAATYTRTYSFPTLYIYKDFAVDAFIKKLSFLDQKVELGNTASVMLASTPLKPNDEDQSSATSPATDVMYDDVFKATLGTESGLSPEEIARYTDIKISSSGVEYGTNSAATTVSDYYTVGTVSAASLTEYSPTFKIQDNAQIYKYTTKKKLDAYGAGRQTTSDSDVLGERVSDDNPMYLYVPFEYNGDMKVFMVELDTDYKWKAVYTYEGGNSGLGTLVHQYGTRITTLQATTIDPDTHTSPATFTSSQDGKTYNISDLSGTTQTTGTSRFNKSLFMDYIGDPLDGHFWYISYVVFSEYFLNYGLTDSNDDKVDDRGAVRFYHISIIDLSNKVYFNLNVFAPETLPIDTDIYMTISENIYDDDDNLSSKQISAYVTRVLDDKGNVIRNKQGLILYKIETGYKLQALPAGYFKFSIDLPNGYGATYTADKQNVLSTSSQATHAADEPDTFFPKTTIIPITVGLTVTINELAGGSTVWAVSTSNLFTRDITGTSTQIVDIPEYYYFTENGEFEDAKGCWWYIDSNNEVQTMKNV